MDNEEATPANDDRRNGDRRREQVSIFVDLRNGDRRHSPIGDSLRRIWQTIVSKAKNTAEK